MKSLLSICILIYFSGCTTMYFVQNGTDSSKDCRLIYDKCVDLQSRSEELSKFAKRNRIANVIERSGDSTCQFNFTIEPQKRVNMTLQFSVVDPQKMPQEKRIFYVTHNQQTADTILYKVGEKTLINKFSIKSFYLLLGKRVFYYKIIQ